jgi:hypothetical protein
MMIKIAACLLAVSFLAACETTKTTKRETLREMNARYASNTNASSNLNEPAPPAEGPEDVPANRPMDPVENPALVPTPLLRTTAIGSP